MTSYAKPVSADLRLLRATVFTVVCVLLSTAGHTLATGALVPLWTLGSGCALVLLVVMPLAGRRRSLRGITFGLAVGQSGLHTLFLHGQVGLAEQAGLAHPPGHHGAARGSPMADGGVPRPGPTAPPAEALDLLADVGHAVTGRCDAPMLLGHLLAALAAGWLLRRGDTALEQLIRWSTDAAEHVAAGTSWLGAVTAAVHAGRLAGTGRLPSPPRRPPSVSWPTGTASAAAVLQHAVIRRGPPTSADALSLAV